MKFRITRWKGGRKEGEEGEEGGGYRKELMGGDYKTLKYIS